MSKLKIGSQIGQETDIFRDGFQYQFENHNITLKRKEKKVKDT